MNLPFTYLDRRTEDIFMINQIAGMNFTPTVRHRDGGVMVWGCFSIDLDSSKNCSSSKSVWGKRDIKKTNKHKAKAELFIMTWH